jgi:hypothetical protein
LPGVITTPARQRLITPHDVSAQPLSAKLVQRPRLRERIRALIKDPDRAHLAPYNTTPLERDLALRLGIPTYAADPKFSPLGSKSGGRRLFAEEGVPSPLGAEGLTTVDDLVDALASMRARRPGLAGAIVKLNEGVSGTGNAAIDLAALPAPGAAGERAALEARVRAMRCESASVTHERYVRTLGEDGGVVEERIAGRDFRSPSVQLRVTPLGAVELLSTPRVVVRPFPPGGRGVPHDERALRARAGRSHRAGRLARRRRPPLRRRPGRPRRGGGRRARAQPAPAGVGSAVIAPVGAPAR